MKKAHFVRVSMLAICMFMLAAVCILSKIDMRVSASQDNPDCKNDVATRDRIMAALANLNISDLKVIVKDGNVRVEGKVRNSAELDLARSLIRDMKDPCISEGGINVDGLEIRCPSDQEILDNVKSLVNNLRCSVSKVLTVSVKNGVATIAGRVPDKNFEAYVARLVESADCVKPGVRNNLVVSAQSRFTGNCSRVSDRALQKILEEQVFSKLPCAAKGIKINVARGVVSLTGGGQTKYHTRMAEIIKSVCPRIKITDIADIVEPTCPPGAKSCITIDGEEYCCTGCRVCPPN
jgi:osmotically-inducible protein OsmY